MSDPMTQGGTVEPSGFMKQPNNTVRDITEPGWRERATERDRQLLAIIPRDETLAQFALDRSYRNGRAEERAAAIAYFEKTARATEDQSLAGKAHWCLAAAEALRNGWHFE